MDENKKGRGNVYQAVDDLAKRWPPASHKEDWKRSLLYVWTRSAMTDWLRDPTEPKSRVMDKRIDYLRTQFPRWGEVDGLLAQVALGRAAALEDREPGPDGARPLEQLLSDYREAIQFSNVALAKLESDKGLREEDPGVWADLLTVTRQNRAWAYYKLAQSLKGPQRLENLELARADSKSWWMKRGRAS